MGQVNADGGVSPRLDRPADKCHARLVRSAAAFFHIALEAAADNVFPRRAAAKYPWYDVVQRQIGRFMPSAAILAFVLVAGVDVPAVEFHLRPRQAVVNEQPDYPRHSNIEVHGAYPIVGIRLEGSGGMAHIKPAVKVVVGVPAVLKADDLGKLSGQQGKSPTHRNDSKRHIVPVEDKNTMLQY